MRSKVLLALTLCLLTAGAVSGHAQSKMEEDAITPVSDTLQNNLNVVWTCVAAFLVFFMQAGFAMVESGFTRAKNAVNIIMKNFMDFSVGSVAFFLVGFGLMFGKSQGFTGGFIGTSLFGLSGIIGTEGGNEWGYTFLIFQTVFAATAATIVSGAMAERTKFVGYLIYSFFISLFIYPVFGKWAWGGLFISEGAGWLESRGFCDFAGSTVVHSVGGWLALAGAVILGPRIGKYGPDGSPRAIPGHSITLAALGAFILWFGWFGFNPGSTTTGDGSIGRIAVTTNLSAAMGAVAAMIAAWVMFGKPDASMTLNGGLAGLVAITAPCATVTPICALIIGGVAGILVVVSVVTIDRVLKVDDPVGAVSVHGVCGVWGTLACGLFNAEGVIAGGGESTGLFYGGGFGQMITQGIGVVTAFVWAFGLGFVLFSIIKATVGLRVTKEEEIAGLDVGEHGMEAYSGFQFFTTQ